MTPSLNAPLENVGLSIEASGNATANAKASTKDFTTPPAQPFSGVLGKAIATKAEPKTSHSHSVTGKAPNSKAVNSSGPAIKEKPDAKGKTGSLKADKNVSTDAAQETAPEAAGPTEANRDDSPVALPVDPTTLEGSVVILPTSPLTVSTDSSALPLSIGGNSETPQITGVLASDEGASSPELTSSLSESQSFDAAGTTPLSAETGASLTDAALTGAISQAVSNVEGLVGFTSPEGLPSQAKLPEEKENTLLTETVNTTFQTQPGAETLAATAGSSLTPEDASLKMSTARENTAPLFTLATGQQQAIDSPQTVQPASELPSVEGPKTDPALAFQNFLGTGGSPAQQHSDAQASDNASLAGTNPTAAAPPGAGFINTLAKKEKGASKADTFSLSTDDLTRGSEIDALSVDGEDPQVSIQGLDALPGQTKVPALSGAKGFAEGLPPVSESLTDQVVRGATLSVQNGRKEIALQLNPENLGQLRINLTSMGENQISARLVASNVETHKQLQEQMNSLKTALENQGLQVQRITIIHAGGNQMDSGTQTSDQASAESRQNAFQQLAQQQASQQYYPDAKGQHRGVGTDQTGGKTAAHSIEEVEISSTHSVQEVSNSGGRISLLI